MFAATTSISGDFLRPDGRFDFEAFGAQYGGVTVSKLNRGALLFAQGDAGDSVFYLAQGRAHVSVISPEGKEAIIDILEAGDFCGEGCLLGERTRVATIACAEDSVAVRLDKSRVNRAIEQDQQFCRYFLTYVLGSMVRLRQGLVSHHFDHCEMRLARVLLQLANVGKEGPQEGIIKNVDQAILSQMVRATRSRINYFMNKFRRAGYIRYDWSGIVVYASLLTILTGMERHSSDA